MAAFCRCSPSYSKLETTGFICSGLPHSNGVESHWLCGRCVGPRLTCVRHPRATVVPVQGLWADTRFCPRRACRPPLHDALPSLTAADVSVNTAGAYGFRLHIQASAVPTAPVVIKLMLAGVFGHRYAVVWPGCSVAWLFPRPVQTSNATFRAGNAPVRVKAVESWPAWSIDADSGKQTLLGLPQEIIQRIMESPCARQRWWFVLPRVDPPLRVPKVSTAGPAVCQPDLGSRCDNPLTPFGPTLEPSSRVDGAVRCSWCRSTMRSKDAWLRECVPDAL